MLYTSTHDIFDLLWIIGIKPDSLFTANGNQQFEPGILRANVAGVTGSTPYIIWGNYAVLLLAAAVIGAYWATTKLTIRPGT